jgi:gliding motility-associated-like protein
MKRAFLAINLFLLISIGSMGQCVNPPTVTLSSLSGSTCGTTSVTVTGNTFGGNATGVTIKTYGKGTINPASATKTPFDFTYKPSAADIGTNVLIIITTNRLKNSVCVAVTITYTLLVSAYPSAPLIGNIMQPTCSILTGSIDLTGLPEAGPWTITRNPGGALTTGSGKTAILSGLTSGTYSMTVTNSAGCTSVASANVIISPQPIAPTPPLIGTITQPNSGQNTGSVQLNGLPESGTWTLTINPGNLTVSGSGVTKTISGLSVGTYSSTVTISSGCTSVPSLSFTITAPAGPELIVTNPAKVCAPKTVDLTSPDITAGSTPNLSFTYWLNAGATVLYSTPTMASDGTYYIKGTGSDGLFTIKPVTVSVYNIPQANPGPDQILTNVSVTTLNAQLINKYETGFWSLISGSGEILDMTNPKSTVTGLSKGKNIFSWTVSNGVCPASSKSIFIDVRDHALQSLITPNMDGKNDFFILKGTDNSGKIELVIFDRRGAEVYKNNNYDDSWNGVDFNGRPLAEDTYFYLVKTDNGTPPIKGYIVVRR